MSVLPPPKLVVVETPFRATPYYSEEQHRLYLHHCIEYCVRLGESPYASHHYLTAVLDDEDPYERQLGIKMGIAWGMHADLVVVFSDFGVSSGMADAIEHYSKMGKRIEWRKLSDKIVASIKQFGEYNTGNPDEITTGIDSPAVSFADR